MPDSRLTRRRVLEAAGAVAAGAAVARPAVAAAASPDVFAVDVTASLPRLGAHASSAWRTLRPAQAPHRFDLIGADWNAGARSEVQVRARREGGRWSAWVPLAAAVDHAPDDASRRDLRQSDPVWTGPADRFQLRYRGTVRRLRARFVHAAPAARRARSAHAARRPSQATAAGVQPDIVFRGEWGADRYPPRSSALIGDVQMGFVHHTVGANAYGPEDSAGIVLGILRYHRDHNGWNDIGYNFLVDRYGQVFEGRAGGIDQAVVGAQAQGWNSHSTGVACLGDYTSASFPAAGAEAVAAVLAWKLPLHGVPVEGTVDIVSAGGASNRYPSGATITFERISGHRDGCTTSCPGTTLYATLPTLRARAAELAASVATGLVLRAEATTLKLGQSLAVTGSLRFDDGTPPAGRTVQVEYQTDSGQPWRAVATLPVDPVSGAFAGPVTVPASGRFRAATGDDGVHGLLTSTPVRVKVLPKLGLKLSPRTTRPRRQVRILGDVTGPAPAQAQMLFEKKVRGQVYRQVRRRNLRIADGAVRGTLRPISRGTYRVTLNVSGEQIKRLVIVR